MIEKKSLVGYGKDEYDPSIRDDVAQFLFEECQKRQPKRILEIGTYIGYSASIMLSASNQSHLTTIEKNEENFDIAKQNLAKFDGRITMIKGDALEVVKLLKEEKFDFIFIDGPKSQYPKYLPYLKNMLESGGVLMADNINFHGYVKVDGKVAHKHRTSVNRIREFLESVKSDADFTTQFYDMGDGVSFSIKR